MGILEKLSRQAHRRDLFSSMDESAIKRNIISTNILINIERLLKLLIASVVIIGLANLVIKIIS